LQSLPCETVPEVNVITAILAFIGGVLTILSPCILPVLPFVFARSGQRFVRSILPLLIGMGLTFAAVGTLAAVGGAWAVRVNDYGRLLAMILLTVSGLTLVSETLANWITRPIVALGNRFLQSPEAGTGSSAVSSLVLGIATGFLWAPCAGPILGLILTGAVINGPSAQTTVLLFAYALGAMTSLAIATVIGGRVFAAMKRSLGVGEWIRRGLGVAVLAAVVVIALGWDTGVLTRLSTANTNRIEQSLLDLIHPEEESSATSAAATTGAMKGGAMTGGAMTGGAMMSNTAHGGGPPIEGDFPSLDGAVSWLNSAPLKPESLRGKVVMIDFWTYSCINCLRALPYITGWYDRYKDHGLVVLGIHSPEFAFEKNESNVKRAVHDLGIKYPVALDNNYAIWQSFNNQYWPAHYFIDAKGHIRGHHFGEGDYDKSEDLIRKLLSEAGANDLPPAGSDVRKEGIQASSDEKQVGSPETYIGYERAQHFVSSGGFGRGESKSYALPDKFNLNEWGLSGSWRVDPEKAVSQGAGGKIVFRFHARDLHLVLGPGVDGKPVRFRVSIDGQEPGDSHGVDIDSSGAGVAKDQRLYQLIRQSGDIRDRTFTIEFLDSGVQAYSFTFG
jgi:cytochrome c biogenesis protein CcdA/thiol-disulfide isomerase/thioredoxin